MPGIIMLAAVAFFLLAVICRILQVSDYFIRKLELEHAARQAEEESR